MEIKKMGLNGQVSFEIPSKLIEGIEIFLGYYNNQPNHEALCNVTPIDVSYGWREDIIARKNEVKQ